MRIIATDIWHISYLDLSLRLVTALILGGLIGLERELNNHAAGFRTHILVCTGSTAIMLLSIYGFGEFSQELNVRMDPARLSAQVISGIGFLGAGAIMRTGVSISGLTTAASIWVVAAIGLSAGAGFFELAVTLTLLVLISLFFLNKFESRMLNKGKRSLVTIKINGASAMVGDIADVFERQGLHIRKLTIESETDPDSKNGESVRVLRIHLHKPDRNKLIHTMGSFQSMNGIVSLESKGG